jgi:hypothetical protein
MNNTSKPPSTPTQPTATPSTVTPSTPTPSTSPQPPSNTKPVKSKGPIGEYTTNLKNFINNTLFSSDLGLVLTILVVLVGISFMSIISFDNLGLIRNRYVNSTISIVFSIIFIWLIFKFMGTSFKFMEVNVDLGYVIYVVLIIGLLVVFSG